MTTFSDLELIEPLLQALQEEGYTTPTPIQAEAIPELFRGRDLLGIAQTGTGKTAAFSLPLLQLLHEGRSRTGGRRKIRALVLSPTRELSAQIQERFTAYGTKLSLRSAVIFGGVKQASQVSKLRNGIDILVATPGRLLDLMGQGFVDLSSVEFFVLDEADRMLDMGFIRDIRKVIDELPKQRQNLLFSATMPKTIAQLAGGLLTDPVRVEVVPESTPVERINQSVLYTPRSDKRKLLTHLLTTREMPCVICFTRTKHGANRVVKHLHAEHLTAAAIHGNKSQNARTKALDGFRSGKIQVLVATDVAARGIDVSSITHVINFDLPHPAETYVHRIGRTARAGAEGVAISFCDETEGDYLRAIEKLTRQGLPIDEDHPFHDPGIVKARPVRPPNPGGGRGGRGRSGGGGRGRRSGGGRGNRR